MARHTTRVEEIKKAELLDTIHKQARVAARDRVAKGQYETAGKEAIEEQERRLFDTLEAEGYTGGSAYAASCTCGWAANNPLPTQVLAQAAADTHEEMIYGG